MKQSRKLWLLLLLMVGWPALSNAQSTGTVSGRVTGPSGEAIVGAQIFLAGTTRGNMTNQQGQYTIAGVPAGSYEIRATIIGYAQESKQITVAAGQTITANFELSTSAVPLAAIVTSASGQQQRARELGTSVATIQPADMSLAAVTNVTTMLQSRTPGVTVTAASGATGTASRIRIRGSNSVSLSNEPLVIVDGVRVNTSSTDLLSSSGQSASRLNDFNPEQIESIEVLKGPAASALYGTAAANGVIQITTKRGKSGPARWSFYTEQGTLKDLTEYPTSYTATPRSGGSGSGERCVVWDLAMGKCTSIPGLQSYNPLMDPEQTPIRDGYRRQYGLSVMGGGDQTQYYIAADMEDEQGTLRSSRITNANPNSTDRINVRANLNTRATEKLEIGVRSGYSTGSLTLPNNDNNLLGVLLNGLLGSGDPEVANGLYNPTTFDVLLAPAVGQDVRRFNAAVNLNYRPFSWLNVTALTGLDQVNRHDNEYLPARVNTWWPSWVDGFRRSYRVETTNRTSMLNGAATYQLGSNLIATTTVGAQHNREEYHDTRATGTGMAPGVESLQGASKQYTASENNSENATLGAYVQQQFAIRDRIFLTAAIRGDENSAFGDEIGFVTYPSISGSWVVSEESFFPQIPVLSSLRLRSAWGKSGLRPSFRDAITVYDAVSVRTNGAEISGFSLRGTGNPRLRPEIATELELGIDAGFFDDRVALELTRYNKQSRDALVQRPLAPSLGLTASAFANVGSVSNKGFEALLRGDIVRHPNFRWEATVSAARTRNRLEKLADDIPFISVSSGNNRMEHREGYPLGGYWQRSVNFKDFNGDGLLQYNPEACAGTIVPQGSCEVGVDTALSFQGQPFAKREGALTTSMTLFKLVRVTAHLDHKGGYELMNFQQFDRCSWEQLCDATYIREKATLRDQAGWLAYNVIAPTGSNTASYIEDASFVKFRELSISIDAPQNLIERYGHGVTALRLTLAGRNLKTWTDYRGLDPELNANGVHNFFTQEYYTQPPVRYYTARIDVNF